MFDLGQVQHDLKCLGFDVQRYTDWLAVVISDNMELYLKEDGSSQIEAKDGRNGLDADGTANLTKVLTVFKNAKD